MRGADDGLLSRFLWLWPEPIPFRLGRMRPGANWAIAALDKLRELDLQPGAQLGDPARPIMVRLADEALPELEGFGRDMQRRQMTAGGLLRSALGKTRGQALRAWAAARVFVVVRGRWLRPAAIAYLRARFRRGPAPDQRLFRADGRANLWRCVGDPGRPQRCNARAMDPARTKTRSSRPNSVAGRAVAGPPDRKRYSCCGGSLSRG